MAAVTSLGLGKTMEKKILIWEPWFFIAFGLFHLHRIWGLIERNSYAGFWIGVLENKGLFYFVLMGILAILCIWGIIIFAQNRHNNYWWRWIYLFGGIYVLFDVFAIAVGLKFWTKLLAWMFNVNSIYWNVVWLFFVLLGCFAFVLGIKLLIQRNKFKETRTKLRMKSFKKYWLSTLIGGLAVSAYPVYMGCYVLFCMITAGSVPQERYPKYVIPYTPIALSVMLALLLMPLIFRYTKKFALLTGSAVSLAAFFLFELFLESKVIVTSTVETTLESWQMFMCISFPDMYGTQTWSALDILMGRYSPAFKIHFYMISVVIILSALNCIYGFGQMIYLNERTRVKPLIVQTVCSVLFLGLCILACFTAFFRDGQLTVPAVSAFLMGVFFVVLGVTAGTYAGSFVLGRHRGISVIFPALTASLITFLMYTGEMILLSGQLYRFGVGPFFEGIAGIVFSPVDILIILLAGAITAGICRRLNREK